MSSPYEALLQRLETILGVKRRLAEILLAELGPDTSRFPSAAHLASWAGMCLGNHEGGGKRLSGKTRKGSHWLRIAMTEAVALGHTLITNIYHVIAETKEYQELGVVYLISQSVKEKKGVSCVNSKSWL